MSLVNEFGCFPQNQPVIIELNSEINKFGKIIKDIIRKHNVSLPETIELQQYVNSSIDCDFAEIKIRGGLELRRQRREAKNES